MKALGIDGVRPVCIEKIKGELPAWAIECDHCKGRRHPNGGDDRPQEQVDAGQTWVAPHEGGVAVGVMVALLAHVAFQHSTLPVREIDIPTEPPPFPTTPLQGYQLN